MTVIVAVWTKHDAFTDDGTQFSFTLNDPSLAPFIHDWTNNPDFDRIEVWTEE